MGFVILNVNKYLAEISFGNLTNLGSNYSFDAKSGTCIVYKYWLHFFLLWQCLQSWITKTAS